MSANPENFSKQLMAVAVIFFSMLGAGTSMGMNAVIFSISLKDMDCPSMMIGAILSLEMLAILLTHVALSRFPETHPRVFMLASMLFRITALIVMPFFLTPQYWVILIIIHGFGMFTFLMLLQSWLNAIPIQKCRGLLMSTWGTALSIGLTVGPMIVTVTEDPALPALLKPIPYLHVYADHLPFLISTLISFIAVIPILLGWSLAPMIKHNKSIKSMTMLKAEPVVMAAGLLVGCSIFGVQSFITLYGMMNNLNLHDALLLLSAFMFGAFTLEAPIATLSDIFKREKVMMIAAGVGLICAACLPIVIYNQYQSWLLLYIWGGVDSAMFSISLATLGERFSKDYLIVANRTFFTMHVIGGAIGAFMIGTIMELFQSDGLPYSIMIATVIYIVYSLAYYISSMGREEKIVV